MAARDVCKTADETPMNFVMLFLAGYLAIIQPATFYGIPEVPQQVAQVPWDDGLLIYGHSWLAGEAFDLRVGSEARALDAGGNVYLFVVAENSAYVSRSNIQGVGGDLPLVVDGRDKLISEIIADMMTDGSIVLFTCYQGSGNITTGRRFVLLVPVFSER